MKENFALPGLQFAPLEVYFDYDSMTPRPKAQNEPIIREMAKPQFDPLVFIWKLRTTAHRSLVKETRKSATIEITTEINLT